MDHKGNEGEEGGESCDGAPHHLQRWGYPQRHRQALEDFAPDIKVDWVRMAQSVLRYNVVIVGKYFNKGSWVSEAWRKEHPEEFADEQVGPSERIATVAERREELHLEPGPRGSACVRSSDTPPPHSARLTSAGRATPHEKTGRLNS